MSKIEVIAEIANAHQGDPELAIELASRAIESGCNSVKFQVYFAHELLVRKHPRYEHFKNQAFSVNQWEDIFKQVKHKGADIYCDIFGLDAFEIAKENDIDGYKIHSSDLNNSMLLSRVSQVKARKIIL